MDNSILVGQYLWKIVTDNEEVKELISKDKVQPLFALADTTFPFVVYSRDSLTPTYTKDMLSGNAVSFTFIVVSNKYWQTLNLANAVRHSLECKQYKDEDITIHPIKLTSMYEESIDDAYVQRMTFTMDVS